MIFGPVKNVDLTVYTFASIIEFTVASKLLVLRPEFKVFISLIYPGFLFQIISLLCFPKCCKEYRLRWIRK